MPACPPKGVAKHTHSSKLKSPVLERQHKMVIILAFQKLRLGIKIQFDALITKGPSQLSLGESKSVSHQTVFFLLG